MNRYLSCVCILILFISSCSKRDTQSDQTSENTRDSSITSSSNSVARVYYIDPNSFPLIKATKSPASLLKKNNDGTLLIKIKPQVYTSEMGCTMMMDEEGHTFSQLYYVISFSIQDLNYYTIWEVHFGKGPPVRLDRNKEYRFLIKPYRLPEFKNESVSCSIISIWKGDELIFQKEQEKKTQPTDSPAIE